MQPKAHNRKKKHIVKPEYKNLNAFKAEQKHYKLYQNQETDFSTLFVPKQQDFVMVDGYKVCELPFPQGAYYVQNFNQYSKVIQVGYFALNHYCNRPYRTNLDSRQELYPNQQNKLAQVKQQSKVQQQSSIPKQITQKIENKQSQTKINMQTKNEEQNKDQKNTSYYFNQKIRWANVGYQYDWTLRKYPQIKTPVHESIQQLSDKANKLYNSIQHLKKEYRPQSAIVNYYGVKDYMTGHLDDAQIDQQSPIYSFSFGLSCVFLIGGQTKEEKPTAIRLNSGDLLIMAGQSRKCYHGVPRVLESTFSLSQADYQKQIQIKQDIKIFQAKGLKDQNEHQNSYQNILNYYKSHRININIRQVYPQIK